MERGAGIARRRDVTNRNSGTRQEMSAAQRDVNFENKMKVFCLRTSGRKRDISCHISFIGPQYQLPSKLTDI